MKGFIMKHSTDQSPLVLHSSTTHLYWSLTEQCVGETVPQAPIVPSQPLATYAGSKAERSTEDTDEHVAGADVNQQEIHGSLQSGKAWKHQENKEVTEEAQDKDET